MNLVIVDYGVGNLGSIPNMLGRLGSSAEITSDVARILAADRLILPGVGAFDAGMASIEARGLLEPMRQRVLDDGIATLGLCLGMELLFESSEEGVRAGLGWIPGHVVRFRFDVDQRRPIPHMGWNTIDPTRDSPLLKELDASSRFYFAHSFHADGVDDADVVATTEYGRPFASIVSKGNVHGAQFHPEKSHRFGLQFLANFLAV
jgi:glutamine amidotransferase